MLLSKLLHQMNWSLGQIGVDDIVLAVGSPNGAWKAFSVIELGRLEDDDIAVISIGKGPYWTAGMSTSKLRGLIEDFIRENGDLKVAVLEGGTLHTHLDLNVDQDIDSNGDDVNVAIIQAYMVKASPKP